MRRSRLHNRFLKGRTEVNKTAFKQQRNYCISLFLKEKKNVFKNLGTKNITDNKQVWKTMKPSCSNNSKNHIKITLLKIDAMISHSRWAMAGITQINRNVAFSLWALRYPPSHPPHAHSQEKIKYKIKSEMVEK